MKRISAAICIMLAVVLIISLAACGEEPQENTSSAQTEPVTELSPAQADIIPTSYDGKYVVVKYFILGEEIPDEDNELAGYTVEVTGTRFLISFAGESTVGIADYEDRLLYPEDSSSGAPVEFSITGNTLTIGSEDQTMLIAEKVN